VGAKVTEPRHRVLLAPRTQARPQRHVQREAGRQPSNHGECAPLPHKDLRGREWLTRHLDGRIFRYQQARVLPIREVLHGRWYEAGGPTHTPLRDGGVYYFCRGKAVPELEGTAAAARCAEAGKHDGVETPLAVAGGPEGLRVEGAPTPPGTIARAPRRANWAGHVAVLHTHARVPRAVGLVVRAR
jgi:hypothetical protein